MQGLIANAVKYNCSNGLVRFSLTISEKNAVLRIGNTGPSIPHAERERIFERFYRIDASRSQRIPGTGLGLSLAREIVRVHGGTLTLEQTDDSTNSFAVSLPFLS